MTVDKASWLQYASKISPYDPFCHQKKVLLRGSLTSHHFSSTFVLKKHFLVGIGLVLVSSSNVFCCSCNNLKIQALAKFIENSEWNVSAWIIRPEKLIVPQWTTSVNRMCGRMSLNHALCLGGLHKQSSQWSRVCHYHRQVLRVCILWAAVIPGLSRRLVPSICKLDNNVPNGLKIQHYEEKKNKILMFLFVFFTVVHRSPLSPASYSSESLCKLLFRTTFCTVIQVKRLWTELELNICPSTCAGLITTLIQFYLL